MFKLYWTVENDIITTARFRSEYIIIIYNNIRHIEDVFKTINNNYLGFVFEYKYKYDIFHRVCIVIQTFSPSITVLRVFSETFFGINTHSKKSQVLKLTHVRIK